MVAWVTAELRAPGVSAGSGSPESQPVAPAVAPSSTSVCVSPDAAAVSDALALGGAGEAVGSTETAPGDASAALGAEGAVVAPVPQPPTRMASATMNVRRPKDLIRAPPPRPAPRRDSGLIEANAIRHYLCGAIVRVLAPEDHGRICLDLNEEGIDVRRWIDAVVAVPVQVPVTPEEDPDTVCRDVA